MATVASYRDLAVWQRAMDVVVECYKVTEAFPRTETYGLAAQLQRAVVSIPSNIAEGAGRGHTREYIHHLFAANRLGYLVKDRLELILAQTNEVGRMLCGLVNALEKRL